MSKLGNTPLRISALRPSPLPNMGDKALWDYAAKGEFRLQRCLDCGEFRYIPASNCPACLSEAVEWAPMSGWGKIASWCVFHRPYFPELPPPYLVVIVETEEGPFVVGNLLDATEDMLRLDMQVVAQIEKTDWNDGSEGGIVQWRLAK